MRFLLFCLGGLSSLSALLVTSVALATTVTPCDLAMNPENALLDGLEPRLLTNESNNAYERIHPGTASARIDFFNRLSALEANGFTIENALKPQDQYTSPNTLDVSEGDRVLILVRVNLVLASETESFRQWDFQRFSLLTTIEGQVINPDSSFRFYVPGGTYERESRSVEILPIGRMYMPRSDWRIVSRVTTSISPPVTLENRQRVSLEVRDRNSNGFSFELPVGFRTGESELVSAERLMTPGELSMGEWEYLEVYKLSGWSNSP